MELSYNRTKQHVHLTRGKHARKLIHMVDQSNKKNYTVSIPVPASTHNTHTRLGSTLCSVYTPKCCTIGCVRGLLLRYRRLKGCIAALRKLTIWNDLTVISIYTLKSSVPISTSIQRLLQFITGINIL